MKNLIRFWSVLPRMGKACVALCLLALYSIIFGAYQYNRGYNAAIRAIEAHTDTIIDTVIHYDTINIPKPVEIKKTIVKHKTDTFKLTKIDTFNNMVVVDVPIEQSTYNKDSVYTAWVSGYKARLDSIRVYPKTITTTNTITKRIKKKSKLALTAGLGYGYSTTDKKMTPTINIGVGIPIISF